MVGPIFNHGFMRAVSLCLALSFLMMSLVPAGFMPDKTTSGYTITICSGAGFKDIFVPADHAPEQEMGSEVCAFALTAVYTPVDKAPSVLTDLVTVFWDQDFVVALNTTLPATKTYFSQGPPALIAA